VIADPFAALGDRNRRVIVATLAAGERCVGELADELPISRPAVSRHLRILQEAGLVTHRPDGVRNLYRLDGQGAAEIRAYLEGVWGEAIGRFKMVAENTAQES
jgi:DNA-binding transcriptional ArsR family regulator